MIILILLLFLAGSRSEKGTTTSVWIDMWYVKEFFTVFQDGGTFLAINITGTDHIVQVQDGSRMWVSKKVPLPTDYIMNIGIFNSSVPISAQVQKQRLLLFENMVSLEAVKYRTHDSKQHRSSFSNMCNHVAGRSSHRHNPVVPVCETQDQLLSEDKYKEWAQHQRDNTIGLEPRLFTVHANGKDLTISNRRACLFYTFNAHAWFLHKPSTTVPLFWQGSFVLVTVYSDATSHIYKLFLASSVEVWYTDRVNNEEGSNLLFVSVVRDISLGHVKIFENGKKLPVHMNANGADSLFTAFEQVGEELDHSTVVSLSAEDSPMLGSDVTKLYESQKAQQEQKFKVQNAPPAPPAPSPPLEEPDAQKSRNHPKEGPSAGASSGPRHKIGDLSVHSVANQTRLAALQAQQQQPPAPPVPKIEIDSIHVSGLKRGGTDYPDDFIQSGEDFTMAMFISARDIIGHAMLLSGRRLRMKVLLTQEDSHCKFAMRFQDMNWVSEEVTVNRETPTHVAMVYVRSSIPLLYLQGKPTSIHAENDFQWSSSPGLAASMLTVARRSDDHVLSFDVIRSAMAPDQVQSLANLAFKEPAPPPKPARNVPIMDLDIEHLPRIHPHPTMPDPNENRAVVLGVVWVGISLAGLLVFLVSRRSGRGGSKMSKIV